MKVLLYCGYRVGSKSFGEWLGKEMKIPFYFEPLSKAKPENERVDVFKIETDFIAKISPMDGFDYDYLLKFFDKVIVLYREDTLEQAESIVWSLHKNVWHQNNEKTNNYEIDDDFLDDHKKEILDHKHSLDFQNNMYKELRDCLVISYEEFFYTRRCIKQVEGYLRIKTETTPVLTNKLRNRKRYLTTQLKNELLQYGNELKYEIRSEVKRELLKVLKNEVYGELKHELKNQLREELREELKQEVKEQLKNEL